MKNLQPTVFILVLILCLVLMVVESGQVFK
jgi:hypothetical protein